MVGVDAGGNDNVHDEVGRVSCGGQRALPLTCLVYRALVVRVSHDDSLGFGGLEVYHIDCHEEHFRILFSHHVVSV